MPRVTSKYFLLKGVEYNININCNSKGVFSTNLPNGFYEPLGLDSKESGNTLEFLLKKINTAYTKYLDTDQKEELYLNIRYSSSGYYAQDGFKDFFSSSAGSLDSICFDFCVLLKITRGDVISWYEMDELEPSLIFSLKESGNDKEIKGGKFLKNSRYSISTPKYILIPYSDGAYDTLIKMRFALVDLSSGIANLMRKKTTELSSLLENGIVKRILSEPLK